MISLDQILNQYPESLQIYRLSILREYLQYKILRSIFENRFSDKLVFLGGTALRIVHNNTRFSEDLDFDNFDLSEEEFYKLGELVKQDLELEGLQVEISIVTRNAYLGLILKNWLKTLNHYYLIRAIKKEWNCIESL